MIDLAAVPVEDLRDAAAKARVVNVDHDVVRRALVAFLKAANPGSLRPVTVGIDAEDKSYVVVVGEGRIGAVYRIRNDLQLKRLRRIPESVAYRAELHRRNLK